MQYEVMLRLHKDDSGRGLVPENAMGIFNPFWSADGIFHDVFEHYFENNHPYFNGSNSFKIFGEMVASGHGAAYRDIGVNNFKYRDDKNRSYIVDTTSLLQDWINGSAEDLEYPIGVCPIPQRSAEKHTIRYYINEYLDWIEKNVPEDKKKLRKQLKNMVRRCYAWGFKRGEKIANGDKDHSYDYMNKFLDTWDEFSIYDPFNLMIADEEAYPPMGFKFIITTRPKLHVETLVVDQVRREWPFKLVYAP